VVKHAAASEVQVALKLEANQLTLTVADNGRDFVVNDPASKPPMNPDRIMHGHGLPNMKRRLAEIGGACEIQGVAGQGTTVTVRVPLRG
jgi:signal transduction histidine kinase